MICKKCGAEFDGAFCPKCGERAEEKLTVCPVCGRERAEGENFCAKCGYAFERQATATQKPQVKITFDKEALIGGVRKFYKVALNIGKVFFSLLLFLILASPIMLHEGINTAGSGYTNAFNLYVDGRFTAVCAILMIIAFYSLIYAVFRCVRYFVFHNGKEGKTDRIAYFALNLAVFVLCCVGCSGAGDWFADAGAGLSFGIFVGIVGMALSVLRYLFEDKFVDADGSQTVEVSDDVKAVEKKATKKVQLGTAVVTGALVIAVVITSIVQSVYANPFSSASYGFAETRADVVKQFGMPENAKEDSSSYTYYSTEYAAAERMIDALIDAQDKQLTDGFESDADSFDEDDLESMFDGVAGIDGIIEKLEEKQDNIKYKKSVVTFNNDGGEDRNKDTVKSYVCEVITPEVEGEEKEERTLTKLKIKNGYFFSYDGSAEFEYLAKYNDGSFSSGKITLNSGSFDKNEYTYTFTDSLGKYTVSANELETIEGEVYVQDGILYIVGDTSDYYALANLSSDTLNTIKKIEIKQGVTSVEFYGGDTLSNLEEISAPDSLVCFNISIIEDSKFYNNASNWENGKVLYIGNLLAEAKEDLSGDYTVREGTTAINENAFEECVNLASITIPDSVTSIGDGVFSECSLLKNASLGAGITRIGDYTFNNCKSLSSINVPDSVTSIGEYAFNNCNLLTSITIPNGVSNIGESAFYNCSALESITVPSSVSNIEKNVFFGCSSLKEVIIENGVTSIGMSAFEDCSLLTNITIPSSVTGIGDKAFRGTAIVTANIPAFAISYIPKSNLREVVINSGESIDGRAFEGCSLLTSITILDSVTSIGSYAFYNCSSLEAVYITDIKAWCNISFGSGTSNPMCYVANLYLNGEIVTELVIPDGVTSIGDYAFYYCSSLTSITIPDSVTSIGDSAFSGCSSLTSITIPDSVTRIGENAFKDCKIINANIPAFALDYISTSELKTVIINSGNSIGGDAFYYCSSLTSITISASVTSIGDYAFSGCSSLTSVNFGENSQLESIGSSAFEDCSSLTSITIPDSVTSIGSSAFEDCSSLTSVTFGENSQLESIGYDAFYKCSSLTSITIPASVTSIGEYAFRYCNSLTIYCESASEPSGWDADWNIDRCPVVWNCNNNDVASDGYIYYVAENGVRYALKDGSATVARQSEGLSGDVKLPSSISYKGNAHAVTSIGNDAFYERSSLKSITIPDSVTSIGSYAFRGCSSLTSITIPASVTSIAYYAFSGCSSLTSITFEENSKLKSIGNAAFGDISSLTSITIPDSVTSIDMYAFEDCSSLTNVTFGENSQLESIGYNAFGGCSSLASITIPESVTNIAYHAFSGCSSLTSVIFENTQGWRAWEIYVSSSDLADPATAAVYLTDTYLRYSWKRG